MDPYQLSEILEERIPNKQKVVVCGTMGRDTKDLIIAVANSLKMPIRDLIIFVEDIGGFEFEDSVIEELKIISKYCFDPYIMEPLHRYCDEYENYLDKDTTSPEYIPALRDPDFDTISIVECRCRSPGG